MSPGDIGIILLAAGESRRFPGDKRLVGLGHGKSLLETTALGIPPAFSKRLLVLRPGDGDLARRFAEAGWEIHFARDARLGMGHSLAAGIRHVNRAWQGALITLGDMPFIRPETYALLGQALIRHDIVIPEFQSRRGNPVGFRRRFFAELGGLDGDRGARALVEKYSGECFFVETGDPGILRDVDTSEDLPRAG